MPSKATEARLKVRATRRSKSWKTVQGEPVIGYTKMGWFAAEHGEHDETLWNAITICILLNIAEIPIAKPFTAKTLFQVIGQPMRSNIHSSFLKPRCSPSKIDDQSFIVYNFIVLYSLLSIIINHN